MEPKQLTADQIIGMQTTKRIRLATAAKENEIYKNNYSQEDLEYLNAKTYQMLLSAPIRKSLLFKNKDKKNITNFNKTLSPKIIGMITNKSLDNHIKNQEQFYRENNLTNFIFDGTIKTAGVVITKDDTTRRINAADAEYERELDEMNKENNEQSPQPSSSKRLSTSSVNSTDSTVEPKSPIRSRAPSISDSETDEEESTTKINDLIRTPDDLKRKPSRSISSSPPLSPPSTSFNYTTPPYTPSPLSQPPEKKPRLDTSKISTPTTTKPKSTYPSTTPKPGINPSAMSEATAAAGKILSARNSSWSTAQSRSITPKNDDEDEDEIEPNILYEANRITENIVNNIDGIFISTQGNYFDPSPSTPAPGGPGTTTSPKPLDPKDLYPIFQFSKYEGRTDPLNPTKKPREINYMFKREGNVQIDMNAKSAKEFEKSIDKLSFEKTNEAFILNIKLKDKIKDNSASMTKMLNEFSTLAKKYGISTNFNYITGTLTIEFSSKKMIAEVLDDLKNNSRKKDSKGIDTNEFEKEKFKNLFNNLSRKFIANEQVQNFLKQEEEKIKTTLNQKLAQELNTDPTKPQGLLKTIIDSFTKHASRNFLTLQQQKNLALDAKNRIENNYKREFGILKEISKLSLLRNIMVNGSGPRGTNFDSITKETIIESIADSIFNRFNKMLEPIAKNGMDLNASKLKDFIRGQLESHNNSSIDPLIAYANEKVPQEALQDIKATIIKEIDNKIEEQKKELTKNLAERAAIPSQIEQIIQAQLQLVSRSGVPTQRM
jgi:hypothetical protein